MRKPISNVSPACKNRNYSWFQRRATLTHLSLFKKNSTDYHCLTFCLWMEDYWRHTQSQNEWNYITWYTFAKHIFKELNINFDEPFWTLKKSLKKLSNILLKKVWYNHSWKTFKFRYSTFIENLKMKLKWKTNKLNNLNNCLIVVKF